MSKGKRNSKLPGFMRTVVADNLERLIAHHYKHIPTKTARVIAVSKKVGMSDSNLHRILKGKQGISIDYIEELAYVFDLSPYHLLLPNLEVDNPQVVEGALAGERAMYARFKRQNKERES